MFSNIYNSRKTYRTFNYPKLLHHLGIICEHVYKQLCTFIFTFTLDTACCEKHTSNCYFPHTPALRYDTRCYFNVRSKADMSQLNLLHENGGKDLQKSKILSLE